MREVLILNDVHLGVQRVAGTTPNSAVALRQYLQQNLRDLMLKHTDKHIVINGDLFDEFNVPMADVLEFYETAACWLANASEDCELTLGAGNHDLSKDSSKLSSFGLVGSILAMEYPGRVSVITRPYMLYSGVYIIPHLPNQDLFNKALEEIPEQAWLVLLHANYDNGFAAESDHSLNVSEEQAIALCGAKPRRRLVFGHEHQAREAYGGSVLCTGNQWPSSIRDCLHNPGGVKGCHLVGWDENMSIRFGAIPVWNAAAEFQDVDWRALNVLEGAKFVRVSGQASASEAADVISAISKLRQKSDAFIVSNAVQVEGVQDMEDLPASIEVTKQFDVLKYLLEQLTPEQGAVVTRLMAAKEV